MGGGINKNFEWRSIYTYGQNLGALWDDTSAGTTYKFKVTAAEIRKMKFSIDNASTTYTAKAKYNGQAFNENQEFSIPVGETILSVNIVGPHVGVYKQGYINIHAYVPMTNINAEIIN